MKFKISRKRSKKSAADSFTLGDLLGPTLTRSHGKVEATLETLSGKTVCLYFGAAWCHQCQKFTLLLKQAFKTFQKTPQHGMLEIIYVSSDNTQQQMPTDEGEWLYVPFQSHKRVELEERYNVQEIPTFIVLNQDGTVHEANGGRAIQGSGADALWRWSQITPELLSPWMSFTSSDSRQSTKASADMLGQVQKSTKFPRIIFKDDISALEHRETVYFVK